MQILTVLRRPIITEKSTFLQAQSKYTFEVAVDANKPQIKEAVEKAFNVKVDTVNTMMVMGKFRKIGRNTGKARDWKKAIVTLKPGHKIEFFEGV
ncbi:MAG: rplW [Dehalococcoidia bacterium]|nr:rplW [Dehalococcoidia bacterium]